MRLLDIPFPDNANANANATNNYTPRERAVIAETLRRALPIIWDGTGDEYAEGRIDREEYICHAAQRASSLGADDRELVPNLIRKRMADPMMEMAASVSRDLASPGAGARPRPFRAQTQLGTTRRAAGVSPRLGERAHQGVRIVKFQTTLFRALHAANVVVVTEEGAKYDCRADTFKDTADPAMASDDFPHPVEEGMPAYIVYLDDDSVHEALDQDIVVDEFGDSEYVGTDNVKRRVRLHMQQASRPLRLADLLGDAT